MLSGFFTGMRRYKRSSGYVSRKRMKQTIMASRPGNRGFRFTGEDYPAGNDRMPVEVRGNRRRYISGNGEKPINETVGNRIRERADICNSKGMHRGLATVLLTLWVVGLCVVLLCENSANAGVSKRLSQQAARMEMLTNESAALQSAIASRSSDINVRQEAGRLGLTNSQGIPQKYISVPDTAVFNPASYGLKLDTASIFGQ